MRELTLPEVNYAIFLTEDSIEISFDGTTADWFAQLRRDCYNDPVRLLDNVLRVLEDSNPERW